MAVFIDDMYLKPIGQYGRMKMSHMIADTSEELLAMVDQIGLSRRWIQKVGTPQEHFDVSLSFRGKAILAGAIPVTMRELAGRIRQKRLNVTPE